MRDFAQKHDQLSRKPLLNSKTQNAAISTVRQEIHPILHLQRTIGNQAVQRLLHSTDKSSQLSSGNKLKEGQQPKPGREPDDKPDHKPEVPAKSTKPTITSETKFSAPDGSPKTRTDIGVGEKVTFTGSEAGKWTATSGKPDKLASGATFDWTAPDRAADVTIKLEVGRESETLLMKVIEPDEITGVRNSKIPIPVGTAGAGMKLTFNYHPKKVSFGNVKAKEIPGPATNITGYFKKHYTEDELKHSPSAGFTPIKENNEDSEEDTARSVDTFKPYEKGTFEWIIPNNFKVKTEAGDGKEMAKKVTQAFSIDKHGTEKITKAGAEVERKVTEP